MSRLPFAKQAQNSQVLRAKLACQGLSDQDQVLPAFLTQVDYYRFKGYAWFFFEDKTNHTAQARFIPGTDAAEILDLYEFDAELRGYIMKLSEIIEVWLRAAMIRHFPSNGDPLAYATQPGLYVAESKHEQDLHELKRLLKKNETLPFVRAFYSKYDSEYPPLWIATEVMSFGLLSKWYSNIKDASVRKKIALEVGLQAPAFESFLRVFTIFRNAAAHHSRVWNLASAVQGVTLRKPPQLLSESLDGADTSKINFVLAIAVYIARQLGTGEKCIPGLRQLLINASGAMLDEMDIPDGFEQFELWA